VFCTSLVCWSENSTEREKRKTGLVVMLDKEQETKKENERQLILKMYIL
jgi:hypothetical protein